MGNFCEDSTLVCACSSVRCCWMSSRSSTVDWGGAGVPNCACSARTCSVSARFSCSSRSSRSRILAKSGVVWVCAHNVTGARYSARKAKLLRPNIEKLLQLPPHQRRRKRLREKSFHSQGRNPLRSRRVGIGTHYDDRHTREPLIRPHTPDQLVPIHTRHVQVCDHYPYGA